MASPFSQNSLYLHNLSTGDCLLDRYIRQEINIVLLDDDFDLNVKHVPFIVFIESHEHKFLLIRFRNYIYQKSSYKCLTESIFESILVELVES